MGIVWRISMCRSRRAIEQPQAVCLSIDLGTQCCHIFVYLILRIRDRIEQIRRQLAAVLQAFGEPFRQHLAFGRQAVKGLIVPGESREDFVEVVLHHLHPSLKRLGCGGSFRLRWRRLQSVAWWRRLRRVGERIAMYKSLSGCPSFDLPQTHKIPSLEAAATMLEFPKWRVWRSGVEHIADLVEAVHVELSDEGRDVGMLEV